MADPRFFNDIEGAPWPDVHKVALIIRGEPGG